MKDGPGQPRGGEARWMEVMACFERWLDADADGQARLLADLANSDPELHTLVTAAIRTDRDAEALHFLAGEALADLSRDTDREPQSAPPDILGEQIGGWRVERLLGVGGMGQVWLVERQDGPHAGRAALKMLRFAALDRAAHRRFAREGELLGRLEHPHVARLLEVGEAEDGRRFLVLEYIDGERIDDWCDRSQATIEQRLQLFIQVCEAIAYAHSNLIVHRDLKPSNILVEEGGVAKVLDFGMAKLLEDEALPAEMTELTRAGGAAFTPEYAAPEQFSGGRVTVATDVYSLGVVLYVLLVGQRPHGHADATPAQLARAVSRDEPRRLSARVGETTDNNRSIAAARGTSPENLQRTLRGDLDTILAKTLKTDPAERYASVQAFADDVRRYLDHRPIMARADNLGYRLRKYVRRHRVGAAIATALFFAVAAGIAGIAWEGAVARREATRAETEQAKAEQISKFMTGILSGIDPNRAKTMDRALLRMILDEAAVNAQKALAGQPAVRTAIEDTIAASYFSIGESALAGTHWQLALDAARESNAPAGTIGRLLAERSRAELGNAKYKDSLATANEADALTAGLPEEDQDRLFVLSRVAASNCILYKNQICRDILAHIYEVQRRVQGDDDAQTLSTLASLANAEGKIGNLEAARSTYLQVIDGYRSRFGPGNSRTIKLVVELLEINDTLDRWEDSRTLIDEYLPHALASLGESHPTTIELRIWQGRSLNQQHRYAEAQAVLQPVLDRLSAGDHPSGFATITAQTCLFDALIGVRDYAEAERVARAQIALVSSMGGRPADVGMSRALLAKALAQQKRFSEALTELDQSMAAQPPHNDGKPLNLLEYQIIESYVYAYNLWGKPTEAAVWQAKLASGGTRPRRK